MRGPHFFKMAKNMIKYLKDSFAELNNVTWPTKKQGIKITTAVLLFMVISGVSLGVIDYLFTLGLQALLSIK